MELKDIIKRKLKETAMTAYGLAITIKLATKLYLQKRKEEKKQ
jgi:hypothetical protein